MPLERVSQLMDAARRGRYALGYFESWSIDSLQGVLDAAEKVRAPVIIGFNGDFLSHPGRQAAERLSWYAALGVAAAQTSSVPCGFIFNECPNDDWLRHAARAGFNLIMPADPAASYEEYERRVRDLTLEAHRCGTAVEAEIGVLPCGAAGGATEGGAMTDPETAARFVAATDIDLLAVSVGNVHIKLDGCAGLNLDRLEEIRRRVSVPLVLHGGTGIAPASLREAIQLGVRKVNYGTYLKQRYLAALGAVLGRGIRNPHELLGLGGANDLMVAGRHAVRDAVLERIELLGCCGRA
jgi:fructose/tagatose bisphosphate aldolase